MPFTTWSAVAQLAECHMPGRTVCVLLRAQVQVAGSIPIRILRRNICGKTFQCHFMPFQSPISFMRHLEFGPIHKITFKVGLLSPCTNSHHCPALPLKKFNGKEWRFLQNLMAIIIPKYPMVPNPHNPLSAIPVNCQYFSLMDLCSAFSSISVKKKKKTEIPLCSHLGRSQVYLPEQ